MKMISENGRKNSRRLEIAYGLFGIIAVPFVSLNEVRERGLGMVLDYQDDLFSGEDPESVMKSHIERTRKYSRWRAFRRRCTRNYRTNLRKVIGN